MKHVFMVLLIVTGLLALRVPARSATAHVVLRAESEVRAAHAVKLRDIASISGPRALVDKIGEIPISAGPLVGERRTIDASYIRLKLGAINTTVPIKVMGPEKVSILGKCVRISPSQLIDEARNLLISQLPLDDRAYEVEADRRPREIVVPAGTEVRIKPRLLNGGARCGLNTVILDITVDGANAASSSVALRVRAVAEVLTATADIRQNEPLTDKNTCWDTRDITTISNPITKSSDADASERIARRSVKAGSVITSSDAELPPAIHKGDSVNLVVRCGKVTLRAIGEARQDGRVGETVRVSSTVSQGDLRARVVEPGLVEIRG